MGFHDGYMGAMDSKYSPIPQYAFGSSTSAQAINQLAEVNRRLNAGVMGVDLAPLKARTLESIPKQHMKEIERLMKLNGAKPSLHGPITDLVGLQEGGRRVSEDQRRFAEDQLGFFIDRAHEIDTKGNTPVNFHISTQIPGDKLKRVSKEEYSEMKSKGIDKGILEDKQGMYLKENMGVINRETGDLNMVERDVKHYPGGMRVWTPEKRLSNMNNTQWDEEKLKVFRLMDEKRKLVDRAEGNIRSNQVLFEMDKKGHLDREQEERLSRIGKENNILQHHIHELDVHINSQMGELHNKLEYIDPKYEKKVNEIKDNIQKGLDESNKVYERTVQEAERIAKQDRMKATELLHEAEQRKVKYEEELIASNINMVGTREIPAPEIWQRSTDYATDKTVKTVANAAHDAYKKYGENAPIITLENYRHELSIGSASELKETIEKARGELTNKFVADGMNQRKAEREAEKLVGVTWDVAHINFLRTTGLKGEKLKEKIIEETGIIAPYVKQVHLNDNFGWDDAHISTGMGNAPIKAQMEELKKKGFKFDRGNLIAEPGAYAAEFKVNPHADMLAYFETPMFRESTAGPTWDYALESEGFYKMGYGPFLPNTHFRSLYGAGFSNLPPELGGVGTGEGQSRFAG